MPPFVYNLLFSQTLPHDYTCGIVEFIVEETGSKN